MDDNIDGHPIVGISVTCDVGTAIAIAAVTGSNENRALFTSDRLTGFLGTFVVFCVCFVLFCKVFS